MPSLWPERVALYLGPRVFRSACSWSWGPNHREIDESSSELCNTSHRTPSQRNKAWVVLTENEATEVTCLHFFCQPNTFNCQDQEGKCWKNRNLFVTECQPSVSRILNGMPAADKKHHGPSPNSGDSTSICVLNIPLQEPTFVHLMSIVSNGTEKTTKLKHSWVEIKVYLGSKLSRPSPRLGERQREE